MPEGHGNARPQERGDVIHKVSLAGFILVVLCLGASPVAAQVDVIGRWSSVLDLPFFPIHIHLLPTGKVMLWGGDTISGDNAHLWDPETAATTPLSQAGYDIFCSGHSFLADGRLLVAGGNGGNETQTFGSPYAALYDLVSNTWTRLPNMNAGRWYPTVTTLANGDALVIAGSTETGANNPLPQVWQAASGTWRDLTSAVLSLPLYPRMHLAPNGKVFLAGASTAARYLDTSGTGAWTAVANSSVYRDYGSSVMYGDGKVLIVGGSAGRTTPATNTAEVIDLNAPSPAWRAVAPMAYARRHLNATLLPDGTVLVNGGTSGSGFNDTTSPVFAAELWDPATETWATMASALIPRLYHSAALLLPDGRVLTTGGNNYRQTEVFEPPYLFKGPRPTITAAPTIVAYGETFPVGTPDPASITQVTWIRLSSVTHASNMNQRINRLNFLPVAGGLNVTAPSSANLAPPGHYMLFLLNGNGVPSVAKIIQISATFNPVPVVGGLAPNSATAGGPAFTLTVNGSNFIPASVVQWNGAARPTTFVNGGQVQAAIPASDIAAPGTAQVRVVNPAPGGGTSNALPFTINSPAPNPMPAVSSISPSSVPVGGPAFTLTVNGSYFIPASVVLWNGAARPTTFVNGGQLRAAIPASDITTAGDAKITVSNPPPGGGVSNSRTLQIKKPAVSSISPSSVPVGGPAFTLTVNGSNFIPASVVQWNGAARPTTFVNGGQVQAAIPASDITTAGDAKIRVSNSTPDGSVSNSKTLQIKK